jgi:hypothetical protein
VEGITQRDLVIPFVMVQDYPDSVPRRASVCKCFHHLAQRYFLEAIHSDRDDFTSIAARYDIHFFVSDLDRFPSQRVHCRFAHSPGAVFGQACSTTFAVR